MKKTLWVALATGMLLVGMSGAAQSLPIPPTLEDIVGLDTLIGETNKNDIDPGPGNGIGEAEALAWVQDVLNSDATFIFKDDAVEGEWFDVSALDSFATGTFAHTLEFAPDYFMIKTGANSGNPNDVFLFRNNPSMDWAVINLTVMGFNEQNPLNIDKISFISEYNSQPIPEPATMLLLGTGLAGLVVRRWRKRA